MRNLFLPALAGITSAFLMTAHAVETAKEPLPTTVFKNLADKKNQNVVVFGTSLTINGAWTKSLEQYFNEQYPGQVTFTNGAKAGMTSDWGVENVEARVLSKNPDLVFIEFSMNDAATKNNISLKKSEENLDKIVKAIRKQNPKVDIVLQTMDIPWDSPKVPDKKYGSERPEIIAYYEVYRKYAKENSLALVDNYPNWLKIQQEKPAEYQKMVSDGIHPHSGPSVAVTWPEVKALMEKTRAAVAKP